MKKIKRKMYSLLGSMVMSVAMLSVAQYYSFCILIIHQPNIPECLVKKIESSIQRKEFEYHENSDM